VAKVKKDKSERKADYSGRAHGAELASTAGIRKGQEIYGTMSKADQQWLDSRGLLVPGYDNKISYKGVQLPLSSTEQDRLQELVKKEYVTAMDNVRSNYERIPDVAKTKYFSNQFTFARRRAHNQLLHEMELNSKIEFDNKRIKGIKLPN
jgi:hypothetical protein